MCACATTGPRPRPFPADAGLDPLAADDLAQLVCAYHPRTDPESVARLAARFNNPLPLELICTLPKYLRASARDGALQLDPADIDGLPRRVEDIYQALWDELPEPAQQALALATLAIPEQDTSWHRVIAARAIADSPITEASPLAETLTADRIPHGWVRALADWQRRFNEPDQLAIAAAARDEHFVRAELDAVLGRLAAGLKAHPLTEPDAETQHCARLLLTLHRRQQDVSADQPQAADPNGLADTDALRAIRLLQRALADQPRELPTRIALGESLGRLRLEPDDVDLLDARADYALALGESGRVDDAIMALADLLADRQRILGPDHPDTLDARGEVAFWRAQSGEIAEALADFESLLADQQHILGPDHPDTLTTRNNIAYFRAESGEIAEALADFETLLADQARILDPDHPDIPRTRNGIAHLRGLLTTPPDTSEN